MSLCSLYCVSFDKKGLNLFKLLGSNADLVRSASVASGSKLAALRMLNEQVEPKGTYFIDIIKSNSRSARAYLIRSRIFEKIFFRLYIGGTTTLNVSLF